MNRIDFLKNRFNVKSAEEIQTQYDIMSKDENFEVQKIVGYNTDDKGKKSEYFLYITYKDKTKKRPKYKFLLTDTVFTSVIESDPSKNQMYAQWILDILVNLPFKREEQTDLVNPEGIKAFNLLLWEDLPKTRENLILFDENKRKKRFKDACASNFGVKDIEDPTNINQYKNLDQLFAAVFPFKENLNPSELERKLHQFVSLGQAKMPVQDEHFTVFIPKTLAASEIFSFTNWCTGVKGNGMFKSYTEDTKNRRGDGSKSELIVIIDSGVFTGENEKMYQIHFETDQLRDKADRTFSNFKDECLSRSLSLRNFMRDYLSHGYKLARTSTSKNHENNYYKRIMEFGMCEVLFDILDSDIPSIRFRKVGIDKMPSLTRFNRLKSLYLDKVGLRKLNNDVFNVHNLELLSIPFNDITELPDNIGEAKNLIFMNLAGNPIKTIPESIKLLDVTRGGKLKRISLNEKNAYLAKTLREYLPSITIMGVN